MTFNRRKIVFGLVVVVLVASGGMLVARKKAMLRQAPVHGERPLPVTVGEATTGSLDVVRHYLARVESVHRVEVSARVASVVESVGVSEGDRVSQGQELLALDAREARAAREGVDAQLAQTEADIRAQQATVAALEDSLAFARKESECYQALLEVHSVSHSDAERMKDRARQLEGQLHAAQSRITALQAHSRSLGHRAAELDVRLSHHRVISPVTGLVTMRHVEPGDHVAPGQALITVETEERRLRFEVPQEEAALLRQGAALTFEVAGRRQTAVLSRIHPALSAARLQVMEAELEDDTSAGLRSGQTIPLEVVVRRIEQATLLPASALVEAPVGGWHVFTVVDGRTRAVPVRLLGRSGDQAAVEGVAPGETVLLHTFLGWARLSEGLRVEVRR